MVHKNLERPEGSVITFNLLNESEDTIISKKAGYHHHGDTLPLLIYRSVAAVNFNKQKSTRTLFRKESGSGTNCMVVNRHMVIRTLMQSSSAIRKEPFPQSLSS